MSAPGSNLPAESCGGSPRDRRRRQDRPATSKYTLGRNLLGAIFNQDWREDHDCVEEVYEDLLDGEPRHARLARAEQIEVFVPDRSEDEVDDVFRASGKGLRPRSDLGVSSREWLLAVVHRQEDPCGDRATLRCIDLGEAVAHRSLMWEFPYDDEPSGWLGDYAPSTQARFLRALEWVQRRPDEWSPRLVQHPVAERHSWGPRLDR